MKKYYSILTALLLFTTLLLAQAPQKLSYQAVIRDSGGNLIVSAPVGMQISILLGSSSGSSIYTESQSTTTNANGLISIEIGSGTVLAGTFSGINWATGPYFIKTEIDPTGGSSYSITSTSELNSVPYALYAEKSGLIDGSNIGDMLYWNGTKWDIVAVAGTGKIMQLTAGNIPAWVDPSLVSYPGLAAGDMQYWNGTVWTPIPQGTPGQTLKLNAANVPQWQTETNFGGKTYLIIEGNKTNAQVAAQIASEAGPNTQFVWIQSTSTLTSVDLSSLTNLIELKINNNTNLTTVNVSNLIKIATNILVRSNSSLTSMNFTNLNQVDGVTEFTSNSNLTSLSFPLITAFPSSFQCSSNNNLTSLSLPNLLTVNGFNYTDNGSSIISLPLLTTISNTFECANNPNLISISFPALTTTTGILSLRNNPLLNSISLPLLTTISNTFECVNNPNLISISFPALTTITGILSLSNNPLLNSISLPVLTSYSATYFFATNNALPSSQINQLLAKLVATGVTGSNIYLSGQTPSAPPSGSGITDKAALISAGNTVITD